MADPLANRFRTALVTGASRGLGAAFAGALVKEGVQVWGTSRDVARIAAPVHGVRFDLADGAAAAAAMVAGTDAESGGIDLLVHNAGWGGFGAFGATDFGLWQRQLEELVVVSAAVLHSGLRAMEARGRGTIVCVTSIAAEFPIPFMPGYNAAKAAQSALAGSLMLETAGSGISVIEFRAGDHRTGFNDTMERHQDPRTEAAWRRNNELIHAAPEASLATADLIRALRRGRSGVVRSGSFFQAKLAPFLARFAPRSWHLAVIRRYYGIR